MTAASRVTQLVRLLAMFLPWPAKRAVLRRLFGYELHRTSYIGFSWVYPGRSLKLGPYARIGHGTVCRALDEVELGEWTTIGNWNWVTGRSTLTPTPFFSSEADRRPRLQLGDHTAVTRAHYIDCANTVEIGSYTIIAGTRSTILTHEIDVRAGQQTSRRISIGDYCYIGTGSIVLPGASISNRIVLAAGAVVRHSLSDESALYGGIPARKIGDLPTDALYFTRERGVVE